MRSNDRKQKIIQKIKRFNFRQKIKTIIDTLTSLWRLTRWTKNKSHALRKVSKMSALKYHDQIVDTFDEKFELFKSIFFFASSSIDLRNIKKFYYSNAAECLVIIIENEIIRIIDRTTFDKISSSNEIMNRFIKTCSNTLTKLLISLFQICATHVYHSIVFKTVNIITLKKSRKVDYITSKIYKSIALLNIIEKVMKFIMCKKNFWLAKIHRFLLESHMNVRSNRSIETALKLLTKQIDIVWKQNTNRVITLLNLNVIETFDTISHFRLVHNLKKWKISLWIIVWVNNFMQNRSTTLIINQRIIERFAINTTISQSFFISSLLYLFYNANLLKMCDKFEINTRSLKYANDVNILTYDKSTKENCRTLKRMHKLCEKWANRHEFVFASTKYEFIHYTKNSKNFNMTAIINIKTNVVESKTNIRVLNLQINIKLKCNSHVRKIQKKMIKQFIILTKISISIWEVIFNKTRVVYIFVIRSIMIYVFSMWHTFKEKKINIDNKLTIRVTVGSGFGQTFLFNPTRRTKARTRPSGSDKKLSPTLGLGQISMPNPTRRVPKPRVGFSRVAKTARS
jgi:hypothetical protein